MNYLTILSPEYLTASAEWALAVVTVLVVGHCQPTKQIHGREH